jgi:hypothetical protein
LYDVPDRQGLQFRTTIPVKIASLGVGFQDGAVGWINQQYGNTLLFTDQQKKVV